MASNSAEALTKVKLQQPNVILLGMDVPNLNGLGGLLFTQVQFKYLFYFYNLRHGYG